MSPQRERLRQCKYRGGCSRAGGFRRRSPSSCPSCRRCAGRTTRRTTRPVSSLRLNATWRARRGDTGSTWTTPARANVSLRRWVVLRCRPNADASLRPASHSLVRGRRAGPVPSADARLAEKRAAAALRARLRRLRLPHCQTAFQSNTR